MTASAPEDNLLENWCYYFSSRFIILDGLAGDISYLADRENDLLKDFSHTVVVTLYLSASMNPTPILRALQQNSGLLQQKSTASVLSTSREESVGGAAGTSRQVSANSVLGGEAKTTPANMTMTTASGANGHAPVVKKQNGPNVLTGGGKQKKTAQLSTVTGLQPAVEPPVNKDLVIARVVEVPTDDSSVYGLETHDKKKISLDVSLLEKGQFKQGAALANLNVKDRILAFWLKEGRGI